MAIIECRECKGKVSDQATACPHCGAPSAVQVPQTNTNDGAAAAGKAATMGWLFLVVAIVWVFWPSSNSKDPEKEAACKPSDLDCLGNKGVVGAGVYCKKPIELLAKHSVRWTDSTFEMKFSRFRWKDQSAGQITYIGDKAEFQNGFGAYSPVTYFCDMAADNKTVLDVQVIEGRLP